MNKSLVCQTCDTMTMMRYCPKCDAPTVPYEPRGSGSLCIGPPVPRAPSASLSQQDGNASRGESRPYNRCHSIMSSKAPYEDLAKRLSVSVDRTYLADEMAPEMNDEDAQEQLFKERELMVQSASDILRITDGFQVAQKKSIRVIDLLFEENQELKQQLGLKRDTQSWQKRYGFSHADHLISGGLGGTSEVANTDGEEFLAGINMYESLIDEIERRAQSVDRNLEDLLNQLEEASKIAEKEKEHLSLY